MSGLAPISNRGPGSRRALAGAAVLPAFQQALHVYDTGSFRSTADLLGVQPSAISRGIRNLEDAMGVSLFQRRTQGAIPTPAGERLLPRIRRVVEEVQLIMRAGSLASEGRDGLLCVGVVASFAGGGARDLLRRFLLEHRKIELNIVEGDPRHHAGDVRALRMDAAIVVGRPPAPGCVTETLWSEPIMVVLPQKHRLAESAIVTWADLSAERFLVSRMDPGPEIQDYVVQHLATLGHHPVVEARPVGRDGLIALIGLELGITLVSGAEAEVSYPGVVFRFLEEEALPYSIVWSERNDNPVLRRFMSHARRWSKARSASQGGARGQKPDRSP